MKKPTLTTMMLCFFLTTPALSYDAQDARLQFMSANSHYQAGNYAEAVEEYEGILEQGYSSGALFFNLGNAYYKTGKPGQALLSYERAKRLMPRDGDLSYNMRFVRSRTTRASEPGIPWFFQKHKDLILRWSVNEWAWGFLISLAGLSLCHIFSCVWKWPIWIKRCLLTVVVFVCLFCAHAVGYHDWYYDNLAVAVKKAVVNFEPREGATKHYSVSEGEMLRITKKEQEWYKVKRFDDKMGWTKAENLEEVEWKFRQAKNNRN